MIILSHPTGNANLRAVGEGLATGGKLLHFYTTLATQPGSVLERLSSIGALSELARRAYSSLLAPFVRTYPLYEGGRMLASKAGWNSLTLHEKGIFSVDNVYRTLDQHVARQLQQEQRKGATAVYNYEDGALKTFKEAKQLGITCLYDLPIGYWRTMHRLLLIEKEVRPEWAATLTGFQDSEAKLARKDEELRLADHIFVASSFTANTLRDYQGTLAPISVIPYGFPPPITGRQYQPLYDRPLKLLFVGGLSQRKGIADLFEAAEYFGSRVELTVIGNKSIPDCEVLNKALIRHRWIPSLPHSEILQLMRQQDVFVFPSLFEGFGLVITEAMSQGTPVITTERTAGPDVIQHGENGWLTKAGDTENLRTAIETILTNPSLLQRNGKAAIETASNRPWYLYGKEIVEAIANLKR